ncbi:hypothetical protein QAD02_005252 [Eretmocerus hayati]|uniref:Uncharacterized protein n=1 Tax=Eretmocerus hayati TaxID=131215 RepID=A0ACC2NRU1_9HYME|nr:hypothetical protein QAD02_024464 [Eretmocerus hayati]KAJ8673990.1 hypothetical protein QAD02_005252 [Eretmocerus hayati]
MAYTKSRNTSKQIPKAESLILDSIVPRKERLTSICDSNNEDRPIAPALDKKSQASCKSQFNDVDNEPSNVTCLLCDSVYVLPTQEESFLTHLFNEHRLVIGDVDKIASLKSYIRYWRLRLRGDSLTTFCTTLTMDQASLESADHILHPGEQYYLLSDVLKEDKVLRDEIKQAKLEWILSEQVKERTDPSFKRGCIFCREEFSSSRIQYLEHLYNKHNISLGRPENLVFIDEYLDKIQDRIENLLCIYCEKKFKNRIVLKEHMRKKLHKQVNPNNKAYDKYYITNYLSDKSREKRKSSRLPIPETEDPSGFDSDNEDEDWSDWNNEDINICCLFCDYRAQDFVGSLQHMKSDHDFDFELSSREFDFYQKVKIVNYIRKQIHDGKCVYCDEVSDNLNDHMRHEKHYKLPGKRIWDQPEFYFPMFESDSFLFSLDANRNSDDEDEVTA